MPHFFISYRRSDQEGQYLAHMIFRELRRRYGEASVFLDVDSRSPGLSFPVKVDRALSVTDVVLVIIGPAWLQVLTERLEDSRDWVRYEIAESLKRRLLPVVPVCRAGVEMPRLHQLPEELKDLAWRDGVILDPFEDFDRHLARLLTDLERMLAASSREKEELRLARWKLTALLQWRAHQLELAAAQQEAAVKLAAEKKAIQARLLAEERAAKWAAALEASDVAAQEAAKAKAAATERAAARAKEAQKKPEPVTPAGGAPVAVPSLPVSPTPPSGDIVKISAPEYYDPSSGYFTKVGMILSLFVSGLIIFVLAFGYSYSLLSLPFVQANVIITLLYGLLAGLATGFALRWCKVLDIGAAALVGLTTGLVAVYLSWAVWIYGYLDLFKSAGFLGLLDLVISPVRLWHLLCGINEAGSWSLWGNKPTGVVLWCLWLLEAALITGLSGFFAIFVIGGTIETLCKACGTRCQRYSGVARLRSCDPAELKRRLEARDLAFLAALGAPPLDVGKWLEIDLERCRKCGETNIMKAFEVSIETDSEGRRTTAYTSLVPGLLLTAAECDAIERIGRELHPLS